MRNQLPIKVKANPPIQLFKPNRNKMKMMRMKMMMNLLFRLEGGNVMSLTTPMYVELFVDFLPFTTRLSRRKMKRKRIRIHRGRTILTK